MEKLFQLASDIAKLWSNYGVSHYLPGIRNTLILALVGHRHRLPDRTRLRHSEHHSPPARTTRPSSGSFWR